MTRFKVLGFKALGFKVLGAAAIVASALASPAMAQQVIYNPGYCAQFYPNANCQNKGPGNPYTNGYYRPHVVYHSGTRSVDTNADWNDRRYRSGFWPGDVAAGVVGGAVGTAGAIATAPFRGDSYAYYNDDSYGYYNNGYRGGPKQGYAPQRYATLNGFACQPGTWFKGEDGRRHNCQ